MPSMPWKAHVHHDDVRLQLIRQGDRLLRRLRRADDRDIGLKREQHLEPLEYLRLVVDK